MGIHEDFPMLKHRNFTGNLKVKAGFFSFFILDDLTNAVCKCKEKLIFLFNTQTSL